MILVDTAVWIDHFRQRDAALAACVARAGVLMHPFVIGELALGHLTRRDEALAALQLLPQSVVARPTDVLRLIAAHQLGGLGIGYVDVHLVAAALLAKATIWTRDRRLHELARRLGLAFAP